MEIHTDLEPRQREEQSRKQKEHARGAPLALSALKRQIFRAKEEISLKPVQVS